MIISVGYRVNSLRGTQFRIWATQRLREYIVKGFALDDERLKQAGGGNYFDELLARIRDIRSSEKVFWRKVLDIYAFQKDAGESVDYATLTDEQRKKLNIIHQEQDKMLGRRPIEYVQATRPILIIDEPQSVDNTPKSQKAISNLNPLFALRYSANCRAGSRLSRLLETIIPTGPLSLRTAISFIWYAKQKARLTGIKGANRKTKRLIAEKPILKHWASTSRMQQTFTRCYRHKFHNLRQA